MCYARIAVSIVRGAIISIIVKVLGMSKVMVCIAKYVPITIPSGVRGASVPTQIITLVMKLPISVITGARSVAKMVLIGARIASITLAIVVIVVMIVLG
jgi:hypothetical protein